MRHAISVLLENEVGALTRMTGMFSSRGYNIESLNVAPTNDATVSRVTLVVSGSDAAIAQLNAQLAKLVDDKHSVAGAEALAKKFGAEVLDEDASSYTLQLTGRISEVDDFVDDAAQIGQLSAVARSGSVAVSKGEVTLSSYDRDHRLSG
jgi:acetolactate synthase-1/3 small subunit